MPARLAASPLERARAPLARLVVRDFILRGRQRLDGLVCIKAWAGPDWPRRLLPWLDQAVELSQGEDVVLLRFEMPVEIDCAELAGLLPLKRQHGVLASAALDVPDDEVAKALAGRLVLVLHGERRLVAQSRLRLLAVADLWAMTARVAPAIALPLLAPALHPRPRLRTQAAVPFEAGDVDAGFAEIRASLSRIEPPGWWQRLLTGRKPAGGFVLGSVIAGITALVLLVVSFLPAMLQTSKRPAPNPWAVPERPGWGDALTDVLERLPVLISALFDMVTPFLPLIFLVFFVGRVFWRSGPVASAPGQAGTVGQKAGRPSWFGRLLARLRRRKPVAPGLSASAGAAASPPARPRERGLLGRLQAWLVWNTPLRKDIQRQYALRLREVEWLFAQGRIEEALKKALAFADEHDTQAFRKLLQAYGDLPLQGPGLREQLTLNFSGIQPASSGGVGPAAYAHFTNLYREQAKALVALGDIERAVFIHAELLNDARGAVDLLVAQDRLETAARLAQARRLPPGLFIPLWFRAGDKQRALALAARHEAFQELWKELRPEDPFRVVLAGAWARRLADIGQFGRALEVTDGLDGDYRTERLAWLRQGLQSAPDGVMLARALKALAWNEREDTGPYAIFQRMLGEAGAAEDRVQLARALCNRACERAADGPAFRARLPLLAHHLTRRLIVDEADLGHQHARAEAAAQLSEAGGQFALRVDLRRLAKLPAPEVERLSGMTLPACAPLATIVAAAVVPGRRVLIGYRSGLVKLMSFEGRELWRSQVNGLHGLVPVAEGHQVLLVRDDFGERHLSVVDTQHPHHRDLGLFPIDVYHAWAAEDGWLVTSGHEVLCLDVPPLLRGEALDGRDGPLRHWAVPMSEPGRVLFFLERPGDVDFAYLRQDGLVEWWWLDKRTLKVGCQFWINPPRQREGGEAVVTVHTASAAGQHANFTVWTDNGPEASPTRQPATRELELRLLAEHANAPPAPLIALAPTTVAAGVYWKAIPRDGGFGWSGWALGARHYFTIEFEGAAWCQASSCRGQPVTAVFDDLGRLVVVDIRERQVLMRLF